MHSRKVESCQCKFATRVISEPAWLKWHRNTEGDALTSLCGKESLSNRASKPQANSGFPTGDRTPESLACSTVNIPLSSLGGFSADTPPNSCGDAELSVLPFIGVCVVLLVPYPIGPSR